MSSRMHIMAVVYRAQLGWPSRLIQRDLGLTKWQVRNRLAEARAERIFGEGPETVGFRQDGSIPVTVAGGDLDRCLKLSLALGQSPRAVADLALRKGLRELQSRDVICGGGA